MSIQPLSSSGPPASSAPATNPPRIEPVANKEPAPARDTAQAATALSPSQDASSQPGEQKESVRQAAKRVNDLITGLSSDLKFTVDEETGIQVVKVIDVKTKEIIRQLPAQEMLDIAKRLDELQGLLIREKV